MFKKIEIWILYLTILLSIIFAVSFGVLVRQELVGSAKLGWISKTALTLAETPMTIKKIKDALNVYRVEDRFPKLDGFDGNPNAEEQYLLLSRYDGDSREGVVELVDLTNFDVLHQWNPDIDMFNEMFDHVDEFKYMKRDMNNTRSMLRHPLLNNDGELLFKFYSPLHKVDSCSNLIESFTNDKYHHSTETDPDGNIYIPSQLYPQSLPERLIGRKTGSESGYEDGYNDDAIVKISAVGEIIFEKSVSQIFIDNGLEYLLFSVGDMGFDLDPIHLNDIQPVNVDSEFWKKDDLFLSLRHQSMVFLYRPSTNEIIWKGVGPFFHQHDVDILDDHRIAIFNNNSKDFVSENVVDGHNEVIIYNFKTDEYSSYLEDSLVEDDVRTITEGRSEILPNGDLFLEETNYGRSLYYNADGTVRWVHINRAENGNVYATGWSRILHTEEDIQVVNNFLSNKGACND